jgi:hypothetical protein
MKRRENAAGAEIRYVVDHDEQRVLALRRAARKLMPHIVYATETGLTAE